jgi:NAD(P)-dependent dehydrogenase (short-subunit alcohol dehydrogenase family)
LTETAGAGAGPGSGFVPAGHGRRRRESVQAGVDEVARHGGLDAVVVGAGWGLAGAVEQTPITEATQQLETNFWGTVR